MKTGLMQPQVKDHPQPPGTVRGKGRGLPWSPWREYSPSDMAIAAPGADSGRWDPKTVRITVRFSKAWGRW